MFYDQDSIQMFSEPVCGQHEHHITSTTNQNFFTTQVHGKYFNCFFLFIYGAITVL